MSSVTPERLAHYVLSDKFIDDGNAGKYGTGELQLMLEKLARAFIAKTRSKA